MKLEIKEEEHVERRKERGRRKGREVKTDGTLAKNFTHPREWCMQMNVELYYRETKLSRPT